jgi:hypothetical protein
MRTRAVAAVALTAVVVLAGAGSAVAANDPDSFGAAFRETASFSESGAGFDSANSVSAVGDDGAAQFGVDGGDVVGDYGAAQFSEEGAISDAGVDSIGGDGLDG